MTETLVGVNPPSLKDPADPPSAEELAAARELVRQARAQGVALTGPGGLLKALTKTVIETALEEEMAEHLGYDKHDPIGRNRGNSRNGKRAKTVLTDSGEVAVEVPRDRDGSFEPVIVAKRQRRLSSIDEIVLSLYARGLTTGDIAAHFAEIYDAQVSKDTISRITDRVVEEMQAWTSRPLERVYAAVVLDAINVTVRDGQVANRPVYAAIGVDLEGHKDILGMWFGDGVGESAKFWMVVLTELRNRGVADVFFLVCDGLKGLPDSVNAVWPRTIVQTCLIHLIRNSFRFASRKYWDELSRDLKPIYTPSTPRPPPLPWTTSTPSGAPVIRRSSGSGATPGKSSSRSWTIRRGDPQGVMQHQRHRKPERPLPASSQGPWALPHRTGRHEVPISGHPIPRPQRHRSDTMGCARDLGMHRTAVGDRTCAFWQGGWIVELSDHCQRLVGRRGQPAIQLLPLGSQLAARPAHRPRHAPMAPATPGR
jgi:putative transposase